MPQKERKLDAVLIEYSRLRDKISKEGLSSYQQIYQERENIGEFEKKLRNAKDFPKLISYIFEQAGATKVDLTNINYNFEDKKDVMLKKVILTLNLEGPYENLRRFIYTLETGNHFFEVTGVKISKKAQQVSAMLILSTYLKEAY